MKNHNTCFAFQTGKYRVMNLILDNENFPVGKIADSSNSSDISVTINIDRFVIFSINFQIEWHCCVTIILVKVFKYLHP